MRIPFMMAQFPPEVPPLLSPIFSSGYVGAGPRVTSFEDALRSILKTSNVLSTSSGTAALTLVYSAIGISAETTVLSTPMTCTATNIPLVHLGAKIKWLDIDPLTGNVSAETLKRALESTPYASAAVVMDWGGNPCNYDEMTDICKHYNNLRLIADSAQAFGSKYKGKLIGTNADFHCFSFGPTKLLSCIEGGAVICKESTWLRALRCLRWHGIDRDNRDPIRFWNYDINRPGYRFTLNDVFAHIGEYLLSRLGARLERRRELAGIYDSELKHIDGLQILRRDANTEPNHWMYTVLAQGRESLMDKLHREGIHAATPHLRNDKMTCFIPYDASGQLHGVNQFSKEYLCLPIGEWVSNEQCVDICRTMRAGW